MEGVLLDGVFGAFNGRSRLGIGSELLDHLSDIALQLAQLLCLRIVHRRYKGQAVQTDDLGGVYHVEACLWWKSVKSNTDYRLDRE